MLKFKKLTSIVATGAMVVSMFAGMSFTSFASTSVTTQAQLAAMTSGDYVLGADITIDASTWDPIDNFSGTFDGNKDNYKITWDGDTVTGSSNFAIFGTSTGTVKNLTVEGSFTVTDSNLDYISPVVGYNAGTIDKVTNNASVTASGSYNVGGIAGFNDALNTGAVGVIKNSANSGAITGKSKTGGIVGENAGLVSSCSNTAAIRSMGGGKDGTGGIAGRNGNNNTAVETGTVRNCYNTGEIKDFNANNSGGRWIGGIVGFQNSLSSVTNCYSTGAISGFRNYNNIVGSNEGTTTNCYGSQTGTGYTEDETGASRTEADMKTSAFLNELKGSTTNIWQQSGSQLPTLTKRAGETSADSSTVVSSDEEIIYLSSGGDDSFPGTSDEPVATLTQAVALADASTVSGAYVKVLDTITVSGTESVFGSQTKIEWDGAEDDTPMFDVEGTLTVGGLVIDGNGVSTMFEVENGGVLKVRNNSNLSDCGTAIDVKAGGDLLVNRSSITGSSYSIKLAGSTSTCTMSVGSNQTIAISGNVSLGSGATITMASNPASMLSNVLKIECESTANSITVASGTSSCTLTSDDVAKIAPVSGSGYTASLSSNTIVFTK